MGPEDSEYAYPEEVLNFIREIVPGNVKGELREVLLTMLPHGFATRY